MITSTNDHLHKRSPPQATFVRTFCLSKDELEGKKKTTPAFDGHELLNSDHFEVVCNIYKLFVV
jgi:hypothetical protein